MPMPLYQMTAPHPIAYQMLSCVEYYDIAAVLTVHTTVVVVHKTRQRLSLFKNHGPAGQVLSWPLIVLTDDIPTSTSC